MKNVIKGLIEGQIELYKRQPEGSSAKKGEIYNEIKRLVIDLSYEEVEDYHGLYQTEEMRDASCENFDGLIEQCKELL